MILPILISVSLAPETYFFCALAAVVISAAAAKAMTAAKCLGRPSIVLSRFFVLILRQVSQVARVLASIDLFRPAILHCCLPPSVIDALGKLTTPWRSELKSRIVPRHPRLGAAGFRFARWLAQRTMGAAGFHQLGSEFADHRLARVREKLRRG